MKKQTDELALEIALGEDVRGFTRRMKAETETETPDTSAAERDLRRRCDVARLEVALGGPIPKGDRKTAH